MANHVVPSLVQRRVITALIAIAWQPLPTAGATDSRLATRQVLPENAGRLAGVVDERAHLGAEPASVLGVQVNLVFRGTEAELQSLLCGTAVDVVFDAMVVLVAISTSVTAMGLLERYRPAVPQAAAAAPLGPSSLLSAEGRADAVSCGVLR